MRKWVMQVHIYAGLFFFGFLLVFALSSLCFNHQPAFMDEKMTTAWTQSVSSVPPQADPWKYAAALEDQLGVEGRVLHPTFSKSTGALDFDVSRPGRRYRVHVADGSAAITEERQNWAATLVEMHGVRPANNSFVLNAWAWYATLGALALMASAITGLFVWAVRPRERVIGWIILGSSTAVSLAICLCIRFWG